MTDTPKHLLPENCYVCGTSEDEHEHVTGHKFWSNAQAFKDLANRPVTAHDPAAAYVAEHRPY